MTNQSSFQRTDIVMSTTERQTDQRNETTTPSKGIQSSSGTSSTRSSGMKRKQRECDFTSLTMTCSPSKRRKVGRRGTGLTLPSKRQVENFDPLFNRYIPPGLAVQILRFVPLHDLSEHLSLVNKRWNKIIFQSPQLWDLVIISTDENADERDKFAASSRVKWLADCKVRKYIKDLNISLQMTPEDTKILSKLRFPQLRELSIDICPDPMVHIYYGELLRNHPHIQWINGEFSTEQQTRAAIIPFEMIPKLKCLGIERLYLNKMLPLAEYPAVKCVGHTRVFDEDVHLLEALHKALPELVAFSISVDSVGAELVKHITRWKKLRVLYILCNRDNESMGEFDWKTWCPIREMQSIEMVMLVNFPPEWVGAAQTLLNNVRVTEEQNGLAFWNEAEPLVLCD